MAIFWARDFYAEERKVKLEIMIGETIIGDKMYYRVDGCKPIWFDLIGTPMEYVNRTTIINKGLELIHEKFGNVILTNEDGEKFDWNEV